MPTTHLTPSFSITVGPDELDGHTMGALRRLVVEKSWSAADRVELEFDGDDALPSMKTGDALKVSAITETEPEVVFDGEVIGRSVSWRQGYHRVVFEGADPRNRLTRAIEPATLNNATYSSIIHEIAKAYGLGVGTVPQGPKFQHFLMAGSHFAVLQQIARRSGTVWTLEDNSLHFKKPVAQPSSEGMTIALGAEQLIDLDVRFSPIERADRLTVNGWDQAKGEPFDAQAAPKDARTSSSNLRAEVSLRSKDAFAWGGGAVDRNDAKGMADGISQRLRVSEFTGHGSVRFMPELVPGITIGVTGVSPEFNGSYIIGAVTHRMGASYQSAITEFRIGSDEDSLADLFGGRGESTGQAPAGVTIGVVTDRDDPQKLGRIRVQLPLISPNLVTGWIRHSSIGSGEDRGIVFLPEINDEVLVAFEHGELNRPYVIGSLWSVPGRVFDQTVQSEPKETAERRLVSRLGNRVRFIDIKAEDAESGISIEVDAGKSKIFVGYKEILVQTTSQPLKLVNGKAKITLDDDTVTIEGDKVIVKGTSDVTIESNQKAKVKSGTDMAVEAGTKLEAKGNAGVTVQSSAITQIKGSMVQIN